MEIYEPTNAQSNIKMNTSFTKATADFNQYRYAAIRDFLHNTYHFNEFASIRLVRWGDCFLKSFYLGNYHDDFEEFLSSTCKALQIDMDSCVNSSEILWPHWVVYIAWMLSRINTNKIPEERGFEKQLEQYCDSSFAVSQQSMLHEGTPEHMVLMMDIIANEADHGGYTSPERAAYLTIHGVEVGLRKKTSAFSSQSSGAAGYRPTETAFLWPSYTAKATDDDKRTFEDFLSKLCHSTKKSMTKDIKNYLAAKEGEKIITRPEQINTEYEWVKGFGYPRAEKTYYNG